MGSFMPVVGPGVHKGEQLSRRCQDLWIDGDVHEEVPLRHHLQFLTLLTLAQDSHASDSVESKECLHREATPWSHARACSGALPQEGRAVP